MSKYAIEINERTLDLITVLNGGIRPQIEDEETVFIFETKGPDTTTNHDIQTTRAGVIGKRCFKDPIYTF